MKKRNTYVGLFLLVAVLMLGIGYAAISNISLYITGTAKATISDENFKVKFTGTPTVNKEDIVTATITDDTHATMVVDSLKAKGDTATATYTILNESADLSASIEEVKAEISDTEYFSVDTSITDPVTVAAGQTTEVTVTVTLVKTPIDSDKEANIDVELVASPVQP